jgi:hypothetical protein
MKSVKFAALFSALSLVFMGCPYESKVPIDDSSNAKMDKTLLGTFSEKGSEDYTYKVTAYENTYKVDKTNKDGETTKYKGFFSDVSGVTFLNIHEVSEYESSEVKYYLYRVEKKGDDGERVKLRAVTDNITEEFATSAELKAYLKKNMEISFFYNKDDEKIFYKE